ncbi:YiaA/YiaB family inner membrane protein [Pseudonocardia sp. GCM10023141]|uniref:YiaA/YiaB family inner membrane protein n=1 Tax=Pseudonocardia sp. GCM10023141 TaxID=3252653 RepID=UPI003605BE45
MTSKPPPAPSTAAFHLQAVLSFAVSLMAVGIAIWNLPTDVWIRAFLAIGVLYVTTSSFTLAKTIRDRQETTTVVNRVDQARLDKLLAEHDPFRVDPVRLES